MRKIALCFVLFISLHVVLSSCAKTQSVHNFEPLREGKYSFVLKHEKLTAEGEFTVNGPGFFCISFSSPETLRYLSLQTDGDSATVLFGDQQEVVSLSEMPDDSILKLTFFAIQTFLFQTHDFSALDDGTVCAQACVLERNVAAVFQASGELECIECELEGFSVSFSA